MKITKPVLAAALVAVGIATLYANPANAQNACPAMNVPGSFQATEKFFAWGTDMDLKAGRDKFGKVVERTLHLTRTFDIQNAAGQTVATAHEKFFSWGTNIEVQDCAGNRIGTVKEEILKSFFKTYTSYKILDASGNQVATSEKLDLLATNFDMHRNDGVWVGSMHRPWINLLTDHWDVTYNPQSGVDPRLWLTIPAYKTAADNQRRKEEADKRRRDNDNNNNSNDSNSDSGATSMNTPSEDNESRDSKAIATLEQEKTSSDAVGSSQRSI